MTTPLHASVHQGQFLTKAQVIEQWMTVDDGRIADKTLLRSAQENEIPGATKGHRGEWLIPLDYLEKTFKRRPEPRAEAAIDPDTMALIAQNLLSLSNCAIEAHQKAQSSTQLVHEREVEFLHHQLDVSRTETTKAITHSETLAAELNRLSEALHDAQLDLARYQTSEETRQALEPQLENLVNQVSQLVDTLNTKRRWPQRFRRPISLTRT